MILCRWTAAIFRRRMLRMVKNSDAGDGCRWRIWAWVWHLESFEAVDKIYKQAAADVARKPSSGRENRNSKISMSWVAAQAFTGAAYILYLQHYGDAAQIDSSMINWFLCGYCWCSWWRNICFLTYRWKEAVKSNDEKETARFLKRIWRKTKYSNWMLRRPGLNQFDQKVSGHFNHLLFSQS